MRGAWLPQLVKHVTLVVGAVSLSPTSGIALLKFFLKLKIGWMNE